MSVLPLKAAVAGFLQRFGPPVLAGVLLGACATQTTDRSVARVAELSQPHTGAPVALARTDAERARAAALADSLLGHPLTADTAVGVAFTNSPALQALLADHARATAASIQGARPGNPVLTLERLVRGDVTEIGRMLTIGLTDLLALPARGRLADAQIEANALRYANEVTRLAFEARRAWVQAVAAQQLRAYSNDVRIAAEASSELAGRMESAGNFSRLQRAREQAFYADAIAQFARAQHAEVAAREHLARVLGLSREQVARLQLAQRLPDLPASARDESTLRARTFEARLDVLLARQTLDATARQYGLTRVTSWVDGVNLGVERNSQSGAPAQRGLLLEFPLPLFDPGDARRAEADAAYLAALYRTAQVAVEARSQVDEAYHAYRTTFDIARHYLDEIVPLRKAIAEENLLRYNGMLASVFELLADARQRVGSVIAALEAQRDFWLADAALDAALIGRPIAASSSAIFAPAAAPMSGDSASH